MAFSSNLGQMNLREINLGEINLGDNAGPSGVEFSGSVDGASSLVGVLALNLVLQGANDGSSSLTANLQRIALLSGSSDGVSSLVGVLSVLGQNRRLTLTGVGN